ncbi:Zinc finger CCCH domain-containing protein 7 [Gossypium australe]|uniref:Zinc finger CCCH domain-containing protein 7 n=1 Tax=Gossypium australe TaxID=47621 RepID=A0A5B6UZ24_9ROSI|nr:Zinc finger CCCH domain-containing protein 7 [Gossypium australe]
MMAWERMCYSKGIEGINFRDMHLFNIPLIGRQLWRLLIFKESLCFKVLSAKYFPEGDVLRSKYCDKPSFTWSSITKAIDALKDGFLWQIGDGNTIDIQREWPKVQEILMIGGINNRLIDGRYERCIDWLEDVLQELDKKAAVNFLLSFGTAGMIGIILNGNVGYGAIARDHYGFIIGGSYGYANKYLDTTWAEFEAFVEGLNLALKWKVEKLILEYNSAILVNVVLVLFSRVCTVVLNVEVEATSNLR